MQRQKRVQVLAIGNRKHHKSLHLSVYCQALKDPVVEGGGRPQDNCGKDKGSTKQGPKIRTGLGRLRGSCLHYTGFK